MSALSSVRGRFTGIEFLIITAIVAITGLILVGAVKEAFGEKHKLLKSEWNCTRTQKYTYVTYVRVGGVNVPQVHEGKRCTRYDRISLEIE